MAWGVGVKLFSNRVLLVLFMLIRTDEPPQLRVCFRGTLLWWEDTDSSPMSWLFD